MYPYKIKILIFYVLLVSAIITFTKHCKTITLALSKVYDNTNGVRTSQFTNTISANTDTNVKSCFSIITNSTTGTTDNKEMSIEVLDKNIRFTLDNPRYVSDPIIGYKQYCSCDPFEVKLNTINRDMPQKDDYRGIKWFPASTSCLIVLNPNQMGYYSIIDYKVSRDLVVYRITEAKYAIKLQIQYGNLTTVIDWDGVTTKDIYLTPFTITLTPMNTPAIAYNDQSLIYNIKYPKRSKIVPSNIINEVNEFSPLKYGYMSWTDVTPLSFNPNDIFNYTTSSLSICDGFKSVGRIQMNILSITDLLNSDDYILENLIITDPNNEAFNNYQAVVRNIDIPTYIMDLIEQTNSKLFGTNDVLTSQILSNAVYYGQNDNSLTWLDYPKLSTFIDRTGFDNNYMTYFKFSETSITLLAQGSWGISSNTFIHTNPITKKSYCVFSDVAPLDEGLDLFMFPFKLNIGTNLAPATCPNGMLLCKGNINYNNIDQNDCICYTCGGAMINNKFLTKNPLFKNNSLFIYLPDRTVFGEKFNITTVDYLTVRGLDQSSKDIEWTGYHFVDRTDYLAGSLGGDATNKYDFMSQRIHLTPKSFDYLALIKSEQMTQSTNSICEGLKISFSCVTSPSNGIKLNYLCTNYSGDIVVYDTKRNINIVLNGQTYTQSIFIPFTTGNLTLCPKEKCITINPCIYDFIKYVADWILSSPMPYSLGTTSKDTINNIIAFILNVGYSLIILACLYELVIVVLLIVNLIGTLIMIIFKMHLLPYGLGDLIKGFQESVFWILIFLVIGWVWVLIKLIINTISEVLIGKPIIVSVDTKNNKGKKAKESEANYKFKKN